MSSFGKLSRERLATCHPQIQDVLNEVIKIFDFSILCGHRGEEDQNAAFEAGNSKVKWPNSKHNQYPSLAVDLAPYPIDWNDTERFARLAGYIQGYAYAKGICMRVGFDWDNDNDIKEHSLLDYPHIELVIE